MSIIIRIVAAIAIAFALLLVIEHWTCLEKDGLHDETMKLEHKKIAERQQVIYNEVKDNGQKLDKILEILNKYDSKDI